MKKTIYFLLVVILLVLLTVGCATKVSYPTNDDMLMSFYKDGKFGFINREGNVIIEPKYEAFKDLQFGVRIIDGEKKPGGMFSSQARIVPNFNIVRNEEHWGVIDNNEEIIIPFKYDNVAWYNGEILALKVGDKNDVYDITGSLILEKISSKELMDYWQKPKGTPPDDLILDKKDDKYGFVDKDGNVIIEHKFAIASRFKDGLALVKEELGSNNGPGYGYIKKDGEYFIEPKFVEARMFNEGIAAVREENSGFYYIDTDGERLKALEPEGYFSGFPFGFSSINGVIRIIDTKDDKLRYVTQEGEVIFEGDYWENDLFWPENNS